MQLVIIDNDKAFLRSLEILLAPTGFDIFCFHEPATALAWLDLHGRNVAGIIVDYFMPDMNGLAVARRARASLPEDAVIVLVSGHAERLPSQADADWPVTAMLRKPLDLIQLTRLLPLPACERSGTAQGGPVDVIRNR